MAAGTHLALTIRLQSTAEFMGTAGLLCIGQPEPEIGIWIKEAGQSERVSTLRVVFLETPSRPHHIGRHDRSDAAALRARGPCLYDPRGPLSLGHPRERSARPILD
jgi:hypothetical protein